MDQGNEVVDRLIAYFAAAIERQKAEAAAAEVARVVAEREAIEQRAGEAWLSLLGLDQANELPGLVWTGYRAAGTSKADVAVAYLGRGLWLIDSQAKKGDAFTLAVRCSHDTYYEASLSQGTAEWMSTYLRMADTARVDCVEHLPDGRLLRDAERDADERQAAQEAEGRADLVHLYTDSGANRCGAEQDDTATVILANVTCPVCVLRARSDT